MADPYVRHDTQVIVGTESTQGTTVTPDRTLGRINEDTDLPDPEVDWLEERSISTGSSRELTGKYAGQNAYEGGSIPIVPHDGFPLAVAFGNDSTTADTNLDSSGNTTSESGTTLHTIDVLDSSIPPSLTVEATYYGRGGGNDFVRTFGGFVPGSITLSVTNDSELSTDFDECVAMSVSHGDSPTTGVSADSRDPWIFDDAESDLSIFGTTYARVTEFEHTLSSNVDPRYYIESSSAPDPFEVLYQNAEHELTATVTVVDDGLYQDLLDRGNAGDCNIQFSKPSNGEVLRYEASSIGISEAPHNIPEDGANEVDVTIIPDSVTIKVSDTSTSSTYV